MLTIIQKTTNAIDWAQLEKKCFWKDFCRETRQLRELISKAQAANVETCHAIMDKANRVKEILQEICPGPDYALTKKSKVITDVNGNDVDKFEDEKLKKKEQATIITPEIPLKYTGVQRAGIHF
jgi:hypothetical protein